MDELKLCPVPWCERVNKPEFYNPEPKAYCVACPDCGLETNVFATEAEAIAAWNTRAEANSAEPVAGTVTLDRALVEQVRNLLEDGGTTSVRMEYGMGWHNRRRATLNALWEALK